MSFKCLNSLLKKIKVKSTLMRNFHGKRILVNDINIHYEKVGDGQHPVLLLPGSLGTSRTDYTPQLDGGIDQNKFTLIAWDPPGYGFSRPPERDFTGDYYRKDAHLAAQLMKNLGYDKYSIMGWSGGGTTGMIIAANYTENIKKLIVWCANAFLSEYEKTLSKNGRNSEVLPDAFKNVFINIYGKEKFSQMWTELCDCYGNYDDICKTDLPKIKCPTLIMHGKGDPMVSSIHAEYLHKNIVNSQLKWFDTNRHNIHQRHTVEFNKIVEQFLLSDSKL